MIVFILSLILCVTEDKDLSKKFDLLQDSVPRLFFRYLFNSIGGNFAIAICILVDTIFIGWGVGGDGLAALNIAIPIYSMNVAVGLLLGVGASTALAISKGNGESEKANEYFSIALLLAGIYIIVFIGLQIIFLDELLMILGADKNILPLVRSYARPIVMSGGIYVVNHMMQAFVRNDGQPKLNMFGSIVSGGLNIILDALFIFGFGWGMFGAAFATNIATICGVLVVISHFKTKRNTLKFVFPKKILPQDVKRIFTNGFSNFIVEISTGLVVMLFNKQLMKYIGVAGLTAYSVVSNSNYMIMAIFNGTSHSIQPIASVNLGAGKLSRIKILAKLGFIVAISSGVIAAIAGFLFPEYIVGIFMDTPSDNVMKIGKLAVQICFSAFPFMAFNIITCTLLQSMEFAKVSVIVSLFRGIIFVIIGMYTIPVLFGVNNIWFTIIFAEGITLLVSIVIIVKTNKFLTLVYGDE